ncbi:MAG: hypothetical protein DKM50_11845 [Candidatus Margulisiibacteriota bacterium]|nr:MAG: hypothetical protein A2X43_04730 [Candidatus Margulisbacteria bacterium GWD2_39_127]OGI01552.1 MAG: hypothetical protein A2X42_08220 [Candidatus Margulisbacteria bacterium GWF2_38_17]OGI09993.1 MAG: hypothetical protein A2X41_08930 [Candidatus Margulisbacteria bacterium GWE2_39_32]PZM78247.1 MAG: hypothetical protein DKM50_11845 [Candidatus Margulisiibacteriota bacterium]HAR61866.1 hypothetical protein [Candidatus Margulisiibacteriota bacterium]
MLILVGLLSLIAIGIGTMLINLSEGDNTVSMVSFWVGILVVIGSLYFVVLTLINPSVITGTAL